MSKRPWRYLSAGLAVGLAGIAITMLSSTSSAATTTSKSANIVAAKAFIAPFFGKPTPFPVTAPLLKRLPAGKEIAYLQCATPYCALSAGLFESAAKALHTKLIVVKAGASSTGIESAMSSIIALKPAALIVIGLNLSDLGNTAAEAIKAGIPISGSGLIGGHAIGIKADNNGAPLMQRAGKILADWAIVIGGAKAQTVFYTDDELGFTTVEEAAYKAELSKNCPSCAVRVVDIPVATIGTTAPAAETSDLQAHPGTSIAVFASQEAATGLPTALKVAGISNVKVIGAFPAPANLEDIEDGGEYGTLGLDSGTLSWTAVDAAMRLATHEPLAPGEANGRPVEQLLTKATLGTSQVSDGWSGYPDFMQRFEKLWANAKP